MFNIICVVISLETLNDRVIAWLTKGKLYFSSMPKPNHSIMV